MHPQIAIDTGGTHKQGNETQASVTKLRQRHALQVDECETGRNVDFVPKPEVMMVEQWNIMRVRAIDDWISSCHSGMHHGQEPMGK